MNLFSTRDEAYHRDQKRPVANAYSMTSLLAKEEAVDSCSILFVSQLSKFAAENQPIDMGQWLQYYAFDVVGELSFAKKLGFLEKGTDVDGMMEAIEGMLVSLHDWQDDVSYLDEVRRYMQASADRCLKCIPCC